MQKLTASFFDNILPFAGAGNVGDPTTSESTLYNLVRSGLTLLFIILIILAVIYTALAGLKYVQSQGKADQVEEAREALKNIFIGLGAAVVGVILVAVISTVFAQETAVSNALQCYFGDFSKCT